MTALAPNRLGRVMDYFASAYRFAAKKAGAPSSTRGVFYATLSDLAEKEKYNYDQMDVQEIMKMAITCSWVYSALSLISDRVASKEARFKVKTRSKTTERLQDVINHPFELLLERPNSIMTFEDIMQYVTFWLHLSGNAYLFVSTYAPGVGEPEELWPLPSNMLNPLPATLRTSRLTGGLCIDYEYLINGKRYVLPGENVVQVKLPNPFDYWRGLSPLSAAFPSIKIDHNQKKYIDSFYGRDNAIPTAVISMPAETNPIDFEIAKEQIREQFGEGRRSAIIRAGDMSIQTIAQTMNDLQIHDSRKFSRDEIYQIFGVPVGMISDSISGDSRLATEIAFTRNKVQPYLNRIASLFTANIAPYYGPDVVIVAPSIVPQDRALEIQEYTTYVQDMSSNEARELRGLPRLSVYDILDDINKARETQGKEPVELADDSLEMMLNIPTRLIPFISSTTFGQMMAEPDPNDPNVQYDPNAFPLDQSQQALPDEATPPAYANVEKPPQVGDMAGTVGGDNFVESQATRSAETLGVITELGRWQKVALKDVRDGKAMRSFTTHIVPQPVAHRIIVGLAGAVSEGDIKAIFRFERELLDERSRIAELVG